MRNNFGRKCLISLLVVLMAAFSSKSLWRADDSSINQGRITIATSGYQSEEKKQVLKPKLNPILDSSNSESHEPKNNQVVSQLQAKTNDDDDDYDDDDGFENKDQQVSEDVDAYKQQFKSEIANVELEFYEDDTENPLAADLFWDYFSVSNHPEVEVVDVECKEKMCRIELISSIKNFDEGFNGQIDAAPFDKAGFAYFNDERGTLVIFSSL